MRLAREATRALASEGWEPMFIRWFIIAFVLSGRAFVFTPPFITSTATEVVIRYLIPGEAFAASRANSSFFSFLFLRLEQVCVEDLEECFERSFFSLEGKEGLCAAPHWRRPR